MEELAQHDGKGDAWFEQVHREGLHLTRLSWSHRYSVMGYVVKPVPVKKELLYRRTRGRDLTSKLLLHLNQKPASSNCNIKKQNLKHCRK